MLVRHERSWRVDREGRKLPYLDAISVSTLRDGVFEALASGALDLFGPVDRSFLDRAPKGHLPEGLSVMTSGQGFCGLKGLLFIGEVLPLGVRRAISAALDRTEIASAPDSNELIGSDRHLLPEHLGHDPSLAPLGPDLGAARTLMEGLSLPVLTIGAFESDRGIAESVRDQLARVSIATRTTRFSSQSLQRLERGEHLADIVVVELMTRTFGLDPWPLLRDQQEMIRSVGAPEGEVDQLFARATQASSRSERERLYAEIEIAWRADPRFVVLGEIKPEIAGPIFIARDRIAGLKRPLPEGLAELWLGEDRGG